MKTVRACSMLRDEKIFDFLKDLKGDLMAAQASLKQDVAASELRLAAAQTAQERMFENFHEALKESQTALKAFIHDAILKNNRKLIVAIASTSVAALALFEAFGFSIGHPWNSQLLPTKQKIVN